MGMVGYRILLSIAAVLRKEGSHPAEVADVRRDPEVDSRGLDLRG